MKKVMLIAAAMLLSTVGFAQITGSTTATGVAALPGAGAGANTGLSVQNGDDQKVRVRQAGEENSVLTVQDNGSGLGGNLARVMQTGAVNSNSGFQNAAEVNQSGTANQSTTVQEGDLNNARTNQGQLNDASSGNKAQIQQGINDQAESNYATIDQDGNDNQASTLQIYDNSDAWTTQLGNENKSMVVQNAGPNGSDGHEAYTYQEGDRNESSIDQSSAGGRNVATAEQYGDDNQSKQLQTSHAGAGMTGNRAGVQQGILSYANVPLVSDLFTLLPMADPNALPIAGTSAESFGAVAFQTQNGKENEADVFQFGGSVGASNYSEQEQAWGWGNDAAVIQGHHFTGESNNYAKQYQGGDNNRAGLAQSGSGNKGLQTQIGHRNGALSNQRGAGHLLNVHQRGNDNRAETGQAGEGNRALVVQYDGQSYEVEQNLGLAAGFNDRSAGGNQADIMQLGPDGDFHDAAIECDFDEPMDPTMDYTVPGFEIETICPDC